MADEKSCLECAVAKLRARGPVYDGGDCYHDPAKPRAIYAIDLVRGDGRIIRPEWCPRRTEEENQHGTRKRPMPKCPNSGPIQAGDEVKVVVDDVVMQGQVGVAERLEYVGLFGELMWRVSFDSREAGYFSPRELRKV